jgi:hypothetical protein
VDQGRARARPTRRRVHCQPVHPTRGRLVAGAHLSSNSRSTGYLDGGWLTRPRGERSLPGHVGV